MLLSLCINKNKKQCKSIRSLSYGRKFYKSNWALRKLASSEALPEFDRREEENSTPPFFMIFEGKPTISMFSFSSDFLFKFIFI